jgi:hypothetical protein
MSLNLSRQWNSKNKRKVMNMIYEHDPMLAEIRQIREAFWEESGHNFHAMIQLIEHEAQELLEQYGKISVKTTEANAPVTSRMKTSM